MHYLISPDEGTRKKFAYAADLEDWPKETIICNRCNRTWQRILLYEPNINIPLVLTNDNFVDFIRYYAILVSEKVRDVFVRENITGYILEEANVISSSKLSDSQKKELKNEFGINIKKIPHDPPIYFRLLTGYGAFPHEKTNIVLKEYCNECGYEFYEKNMMDFRPIILKKETLINCDLFKAKGYGDLIFCSQRFKEIYEKYNLTGLLFEEIEVL